MVSSSRSREVVVGVLRVPPQRLPTQGTPVCRRGKDLLLQRLSTILGSNVVQKGREGDVRSFCRSRGVAYGPGSIDRHRSGGHGLGGGPSSLLECHGLRGPPVVLTPHSGLRGGRGSGSVEVRFRGSR